ncbi:MAG: glycosyltransferase [Endomicrobia bacterium]|nr:glycosyltransferase [Endomicrobiia bacterium]
MAFELSICIPTHDGRVENLKNTLDSVFNELMPDIKDKIEICVSDNASKDGTEELVHEYKKRIPGLIYFRWNKNMGADNNFLKAVEISKGKYCLLLGSDDFLKPGALKRILDELRHGHDIYTFNRSNFNSNMQFAGNPAKLLKNGIKEKVFYFETKKDISYYFDSLKSINGAFGYLSCQVFSKKAWESVDFDKDFIGTAYSMAYILLSILKTNSSLKYISDCLVASIVGQDSWAVNGARKRILIDLNGYKMLMEKIFDGYIDTKYYTKHLLSMNYGIRHCLYIMTTTEDAKLTKKDFIEIAGYSKPFFFFIDILKYPYKFLRFLKHSIKRTSKKWKQ